MTVPQFKWTNISPPSGFTKRFRHISHSPVLGYCAVGDWPANICTSPDGIIWTEQTHGYTGNYFLYVNHNNSIWVAVGGDEDTGTPPAIYTSSDGITWTSRTSPINFRCLHSVAWTGTVFVVSGSEGAVLTSSDGIIWTQRTVEDANGEILACLAYNGAGKVVMAGGSGRMWYSDYDGVTWARAISPLNEVFPYSVRNLVWTGSYFLATSMLLLGQIQHK